MTLRRILAPLLALAVVLTPAVLPAQETDSSIQISNSDPRAISHIYRVSYLRDEFMDAAMAAHRICLGQPGERVCEYKVEGRKWFTYVTDETTHALIAAEMKRFDVPPRSLHFLVTLLVADNSDRPQLDLPGGAARALADLRQFLPYKGYRFVDSGSVRALREGEFRLGTDPSFRVRLRFSWNDFPVRKELTLDGFMLQEILRTEDGGEDYKQLLSTSFSLSVGETVVVGTSKLNGNNEALIVLLTAEE